MERPIRVAQHLPRQHDNIRKACGNNLLGLDRLSDHTHGTGRYPDIPADRSGKGGLETRTGRYDGIGNQTST